MPRRVPADVARVLATFSQLGDAARRALWVSEQRARCEVRDAARAALLLARRLEPDPSLVPKEFGREGRKKEGA